MRIVVAITAVIFVIAGLLLPAARAPLKMRPAGVIGMSHEGYDIFGVPDSYKESDGTPVITIHRGETLSFQNDSRWIHIVGPGDKGLLNDPGQGAMTPKKLMQENDIFTTPEWMTPGTYLITCAVHPEMNAKVIVLP